MSELTPAMASALLVAVMMLVSLMTFVVSVPLLWRYRRAVREQMEREGGFDGPPTGAAPVVGLEAHASTDPEELYRRATRGPWRVAAGYALAGLAFALVFSVAARLVYPYRLGLPGFSIGLWIYLWPALLATTLIVPASWLARLGHFLAYFAVLFALTLWAGTILDIPALHSGPLQLPARSSATPPLVFRLWWLVNSLPTAMVILCFNRWVRAVAPLVLGLVTASLVGVVVGYLAQFSASGVDATVAVAVALELHPGWLVLGALGVSLALAGLIGWVLARRLARAHRRRLVSDRSLLLDALWLQFAGVYAMWLIFGGLRWAAVAPVAFVAYKLVSRWATRLPAEVRSPGRGLTFLRVFALGRRTDRLLEAVAKRWRHVGSVQAITGPDVARSTVQPLEFLDFLSGKLASHFVSDRESLEKSVAVADRNPDRAGWHRVNTFFCHSDAWQHVLSRLTEGDDVVLMDLRRFDEENDGCVVELEYLAAHVPLERCLLVVDESTKRPFLYATLESALGDLPRASPNADRTADDAPVVSFGGGGQEVDHLIRRLCGLEAPRKVT